MRGLRQVVFALSWVALGLGCAYSITDDGKLRQDAFEAMVRRVEAARGIRAERPIDARVRTQAEIGDVILQAVRDGRTPEELDAYEAGLITIGLWPPERRLVDEYAAVMGDEIAGLYVPASRALYVVSDASVPFSVWVASVLARRDLLAEFALAHELVHLLQHQRYPELLEADDFVFAQDDAGVAVQAAFEGDALYYGTLALGVEPPEPGAFESISDPVDERLADVPALIRELIGFPYAQGYRLASSERSELLEDPPASTEQVIHPDRRREPFQSFELGAVARTLPEGCEPVFENTVGELQLSILFADLAAAPVDSNVWEGWDGDRYLAARCPDGPVILWLTAWDTGEDAVEFAQAYLEIAPAAAARAGLRAPLRVRRSGREVVVTSQELAFLEADLDRLVVRQRVRTLRELRAAAEKR